MATNQTTPKVEQDKLAAMLLDGNVEHFNRDRPDYLTLDNYDFSDSPPLPGLDLSNGRVTNVNGEDMCIPGGKFMQTVFHDVRFLRLVTVIKGGADEWLLDATNATFTDSNMGEVGPMILIGATIDGGSSLEGAEICSGKVNGLTLRDAKNIPLGIYAKAQSEFENLVAQYSESGMYQRVENAIRGKKIVFDSAGAADLIATLEISGAWRYMKIDFVRMLFAQIRQDEHIMNNVVCAEFMRWWETAKK